jgi:hypothetical protein
MERSEPPEPERSPAEPEAGAGAAFDALRRLEERLDRASDAAERLIAEAAARASAAEESRPPPAGWQAPAGEADRGRSRDLDVLLQLVQSVRDLIPPDLQQKLAEALRELLLALRALIDWYLERIEQRRASPAEVEDIPIL